MRYKESFLAALREVDPAPAKFDGRNPDELAKDFEGFVARELAFERGEGMPEGWVPCSAFWLVEGEEFIGHVSLRHRLTDGLRRIGGHIGYGIRPSRRRQGYGTNALKLALVEARKLGLERVLLTCGSDNAGSRKIIEANGGVLEDEIVVELGGRPRPTLRFWIDVPAAVFGEAAGGGGAEEREPLIRTNPQ